MKLSGAKVVIECLLEQGVDTVFGYPGGAVLPLYDALQESPIRHILTVHEQGAAHAADGYARATGKVGVCIATSGPGATNLVTGIATAYMDSVPLVAITGQVERSLIGRDAFQEVDITGITMPVTKHNFQVKKAQELPAILRGAFYIARTGRPGPVLVDIPKDIMLANLDYIKQNTALREAEDSEPQLQLLIKAAAVINTARRPVLVVGGGTVDAAVQKIVVKLAEQTGIPVVSTLMGLGCMPAEHRQFLGLTGMHGTKAANQAIRNADVIIAVGSRFNDRVTGNRTAYSSQKCIVHIDVDPAEIDKNIETDIGLNGNLLKVLPPLSAQLTLRPEELTEWWAEIEEWKERFYKPLTDDKLTAPWAMKFINEKTAEGSFVFVTDVGQNQIWAAQGLFIRSNRGWITSGGLGTMGFSVPAALGAQIGVPDKRVICICGDGGIKMTGNELYTIAANNLPVITIVINNSGLGMVRQLQHLFYGKRYSSSNLPYPVNYVKYAEAFGLRAAEANSQAEFCHAFAQALDSFEPSLIVLNVPPDDWVEPMVTPGAEINRFVTF